MITLPRFDDLRSLNSRLLVHPNGWIQLNLDELHRLHVWPDKPITKRKVDTPIHDHIFDFESKIFLGTIQNIMCDFVEDSNGDYHLYQVSPYKLAKKEMPLELINNQRYRCVEKETALYSAGQTYHMKRKDFHESEHEGLALTIIEFGYIDTSALARIACPYQKQPDSEFRRDTMDQEVLWNIVRDAYQAIR